jgi:hypothetical protein
VLIKFAKLAGGLRLLILEAAPLVAVSVGMLSARTVAYLVGFGLGSVGGGWLAIVAALVAITGFWGAGANTAECEAYRAQMRAIDNANRVAMASYDVILQPYLISNRICVESARTFYFNAMLAAASKFAACPGPEQTFCTSLGCYDPGKNCNEEIQRQIHAFVPTCPPPPPPPQYQTYPACSSPDCPPGKKVWVQVLWGSPSGNFVDSKGCFIVAYSQDAPDIPVNVEYNPFLPKAFVQSRAISYYLVDGDRFRGLQDNIWKNLESVVGWDKGYWKAEQTDSECRGWRPGWSRKVK